MLYCQEKPFIPASQKSLQYKLLLYIYRPRFSPVSHLSRQRAKLVHLFPSGKNTKIKAVKIYFFSSFDCTVITRTSGLHIYRPFIWELMNWIWRCNGGREPTGCNYTGMSYCLFSQWKSLSVSCLNVFTDKYCWSLSAQIGFTFRKKGLKIYELSLSLEVIWYLRQNRTIQSLN